MIEKIRAFLQDQILMDPTEEVPVDADLLGQGIIDSIGLMRLVSYLENEFTFTVEVDELVLKNFLNLASIEKFILEKKKNN